MRAGASPGRIAVRGAQPWTIRVPVEPRPPSGGEGGDVAPADRPNAPEAEVGDSSESPGLGVANPHG